MTRLLSIASIAFSAFVGNAVPAPSLSPPPIEKMTPLEGERDPQSDLWITVSPEVGMYRVPTWAQVYSTKGETDLTGAWCIWRSGLEWFDNIDHSLCVIGGRFMDYIVAYIEVTVFLADGPSVTIGGSLHRKPTCFTDWDFWHSPSFVDQYGVTWPETQLQFDFPNMELQSLLYHVPSANGTCTVRTYTMQYEFYCIPDGNQMLSGIKGELGTTRVWYPWPANDGCIPAKYYNTTQIWFEGKMGNMTLYLSNGIEQKFTGTWIIPDYPLLADNDAEAD